MYDYLYQTLVTQIECGAFLSARPFPSQREICRHYNVGITTARRVLKMLSDSGYIQTAPGKPSCVIFPITPESCAASLASRSDKILDAHKGLALLMPPLYREGARRCTQTQLRVMRQAADRLSSESDPPSVYRQANLFFSTLLSPLDNLLITDLEHDAENYDHVPFLPFPDTEDPFSLPAHRVQRWLDAAIEQITKGQFDLLYDRICLFYRESGERLSKYLKTLSKYGSAPPSKEEFDWFRVKDRSELYAKIAMFLLRRIIGGEFADHKYLPSIPKLMEEYGVTKETASRALSLLNALGVIQTLDKKGTVVLKDSSRIQKGSADFTCPLTRQRLSWFLDALQIVVLTARDCAASFSPIPRQLADTMEEKLNLAPDDRISALSFQLLMDCLIHLAPCHSLQNIYRQLNDMMLWGYYLHSAQESLYPGPRATSAAMRDVVAALRSGDRSRLPLALEAAFLHIYRDVNVVYPHLPQ